MKDSESILAIPGNAISDFTSSFSPTLKNGNNALNAKYMETNEAAESRITALLKERHDVLINFTIDE
tara:strand:- start:170 stop:370 length:201 start_codon:yes stop_codon:yes gene_type:complete